MKFRCDRDDLSEALQTVQRGVSSRPGIPALTGVLLEAADDGSLMLTTTDLEVSAQALDLRPGPGGRLGAGAGPAARRHGEVALGGAGRLRDGPVAGPHPLRGVRGRSAAAPRRRFPGPAGTVGHRDLGGAGRVRRGRRPGLQGRLPDEARPVLTGVLLEISREGVVLVATDSYRLAVRDLVATADGEAKAIVPERALDRGRARGGRPEGGVEASVNASQIAFRVGSLTLTSRLIEGEFPNYRQLLPEAVESRLTISRQQLLEAVRRVGLLARDTTPVRLEFNALGVKLSSSSPDLGQAVETVEARYEGEDLVAAFNPQYLVDGLTAATGESVRIDVRDGLKPGVIRGEGDELTYLVMPVRLPAAVG